jgi:hypothetical protein
MTPGLRALDEAAVAFYDLDDGSGMSLALAAVE